ncbi:hypothetical protein D3C75_881500 [compost metagenome]
MFKKTGKPLHRFPGQPCGAVLNFAADLRSFFPSSKSYREHRCLVFVQRGDLPYAADLIGLVVYLPVAEHRFKQRITAQVPFHVQAAYQLFEWILLMIQSGG